MNKEIALCAFIDIEGAFDNSSFEPIKGAAVNIRNAKKRRHTCKYKRLYRKNVPIEKHSHFYCDLVRNSVYVVIIIRGKDDGVILDWMLILYNAARVLNWSKISGYFFRLKDYLNYLSLQNVGKDYQSIMDLPSSFWQNMGTEE